MSDERPDIPSADITALRTVVRDGWYNAFTDLALWKDMYWLCYRRGTKTTLPATVLRSSSALTIYGGGVR